MQPLQLAMHDQRPRDRSEEVLSRSLGEAGLMSVCRPQYGIDTES